MTSCECCKQTGDDLLKQSAGYYLCLKCSNRVKMRQAEANVKRYSTATYSIDRAELFALRDDKLLPLRTFIYFRATTGLSQWWNQQQSRACRILQPMADQPI
jgi:hypothetical protein